MARKGERRNKKDPTERGNKGSIMSGDDAAESKLIRRPNVVEKRNSLRRQSQRKSP
jgi:hypothetical protein